MYERSEFGKQKCIKTCCRWCLYVAAAISVVATLFVYWQEVHMQIGLAERRRRDGNNSDDGSDVILSSYMRSGSSFLGQILGHRNDTFYFYEPLWKLQTFRYYGENGLLCEYKTPDCVNLTRVDEESNAFKRLWNLLRYSDTVRLGQVLDYYRSVTDCSFYKYPHFIQEHIHSDLTLSGHKWRVFKTCMEEGYTISSCLYLLSQECIRSKHVVIKSLRLSPSNMAKLLQSHPRLKIVHLCRDPRDVIRSHLNTEFYHVSDRRMGDVYNDIEAVCFRMKKDISGLEKLAEEYPGRVKVVRYEDFINSQTFIDDVQKLFDFVGFSFTERNKTLLFNKFYSEEHKNEMQYQPKKSLDSRIIPYIDTTCGDSITALGYKKLDKS